ncbi:transcriptional repressor [Kiritimatiellaeota bacterium B1221]|nr:transcriptional repressor [Kiritimatiellaeota bacterium B1221]
MSPKRNTRQRAAIEKAFDQVSRPLSPLEVLDMAREYVPNLGMATVYRAVNEMVKEGALHPVELPGQSPRYEKSGLHHHHHFHCHVCDRVYDVDGCFLKPDIQLPSGFKVEDHDITLSGRCPDCD